MAAATTGKSLAQALVAFQTDAPRISLDATNPHFRSKFASLPGVMDAVRGPLAKCGLAVLQFPTTIDGHPALRTVLLHESGEREEDVMLLAVEKDGPQAQGSALTYARRYSVLAVLGLVGDEDDDANHAQAHSEKKAAKPAAKPAGTNGNGAATDDQLARIEALRSALSGKLTGEETEALDRAAERVRSGLSVEQAEKAIEWLSGMAAKAKIEVPA